MTSPVTPEPANPEPQNPSPPVAPEPAPPVAPEPPAPVAPVSAPPEGTVQDTLVNAVNSLIATVGGMQQKDTRPVKRPWTHWGSKK
jgi:hypothetical protein